MVQCTGYFAMESSYTKRGSEKISYDDVLSSICVLYRISVFWILLKCLEIGSSSWIYVRLGDKERWCAPWRKEAISLVLKLGNEFLVMPEGTEQEIGRGHGGVILKSEMYYYKILYKDTCFGRDEHNVKKYCVDSDWELVFTRLGKILWVIIRVGF